MTGSGRAGGGDSGSGTACSAGAPACAHNGSARLAPVQFHTARRTCGSGARAFALTAPSAGATGTGCARASGGMSSVGALVHGTPLGCWARGAAARLLLDMRRRRRRVDNLRVDVYRRLRRVRRGDVYDVAIRDNGHDGCDCWVRGGAARVYPPWPWRLYTREGYIPLLRWRPNTAGPGRTHTPPRPHPCCTAIMARRPTGRGRALGRGRGRGAGGGAAEGRRDAAARGGVRLFLDDEASESGDELSAHGATEDDADERYESDFIDDREVQDGSGGSSTSISGSTNCDDQDPSITSGGVSDRSAGRAADRFELSGGARAVSRGGGARRAAAAAQTADGAEPVAAAGLLGLALPAENAAAARALPAAAAPGAATHTQPTVRAQAPAQAAGVQPAANGTQTPGTRSVRRCGACGVEGHDRRNCPTLGGTGSGGGSGRGRGGRGEQRRRRRQPGMIPLSLRDIMAMHNEDDVPIHMDDGDDGNAEGGDARGAAAPGDAPAHDAGAHERLRTFCRMYAAPALTCTELRPTRAAVPVYAYHSITIQATGCDVDRSKIDALAAVLAEYCGNDALWIIATERGAKMGYLHFQVMAAAMENDTKKLMRALREVCKPLKYNVRRHAPPRPPSTHSVLRCVPAQSCRPLRYPATAAQERSHRRAPAHGVRPHWLRAEGRERRTL